MSAENRKSEVNEIRDQLPSDLDAGRPVGIYKFPDNSRRRVPGYIYFLLGSIIVILSMVLGNDGPYVNSGLMVGAILIGLFGVVSMTSGWKMTVDEQDALKAASSAVGFAVGHASAQQVWRGFRSRPTWRVLCYSIEDPPVRRALVLVDAVNGIVIEELSQENNEEWSA